jgi:hypothetical protein
MGGQVRGMWTLGKGGHRTQKHHRNGNGNGQAMPLVENLLSHPNIYRYCKNKFANVVLPPYLCSVEIENTAPNGFR